MSREMRKKSVREREREMRNRKKMLSLNCCVNWNKRRVNLFTFSSDQYSTTCRVELVMYLLAVKVIMISITRPSVNANEFVFCRCHRPWWKCQQSLQRFNESVRQEYDKTPQVDTRYSRSSCRMIKKVWCYCGSPARDRSKTQFDRASFPSNHSSGWKEFPVEWVTFSINNMCKTSSWEQLLEILEVKVWKWLDIK